MKKNFFLRSLCIILLLCLAVASISCDNGGEAPTTSSQQDQAQNEPQKFKLTAEYKLVRPDDREPQEVAALSLLARGIKSAYGVEVAETTDFTKYGEEIKPAEFEILVGATNREDSKKLYGELSYYDWTYKIISPNVIAICGGSPEATLTAAEEFLSNVIGYRENDKKQVISAGTQAELVESTEKSYKHKYPITSLKLGTHGISEYSLVTLKNNSESAREITDAFNRLSGVKIPIITPDEYSGGPAIFFGMANKDGSHLDVSVFGAQRYYITGSDDSLIIDFKSKTAAAEAIDRFIDELLPANGKGNISVALDGVLITGINVSEGTNSLRLDSASEKELVTGLLYEERLYYDPDGNPVRAYILTISAGAARIETSMPSDGYTSGKVSNIKNQLNAAALNGKKVIAGINADFFDMGGTNVMRGLCIKDGKIINDAGSRPWFGITSDGKAVIGRADEFSSTYYGKLSHAVGGSDIILKNDTVNEVDVGEEFADTRHPRTAVGIKPNGDLVFMVVDGRQPDISNGATLADLADIFADLGCSDAINLDGGGSSTFVLKENSTFNVKNSPSAGALRSVANGLMVILP